MMSSKKIGLVFPLAVLSGLVAVGCSDTASSCLAACQHLVACVNDAGGYQHPPTACEDTCNSAADAGYDGCKTPGATYDCIAGLSCPDIGGFPAILNLTHISAVVEQMDPSEAFLVCLQKAECNGGH